MLKLALFKCWHFHERFDVTFECRGTQWQNVDFNLWNAPTSWLRGLPVIWSQVLLYKPKSLRKQNSDDLSTRKYRLFGQGKHWISLQMYQSTKTKTPWIFTNRFWIYSFINSFENVHFFIQSHQSHPRILVVCHCSLFTEEVVHQSLTETILFGLQLQILFGSGQKFYIVIGLFSVDRVSPARADQCEHDGHHQGQQQQSVHSLVDHCGGCPARVRFVQESNGTKVSTTCAF